MVINDIEFALRMWIDDVDGKTLLDEVFGSFEEMNQFIEITWKEPQYGDMAATFSPVEVVNGKPEEAVSILYDIYPYMPLDPSEIEDYIFDIKADFKRIAEENERMDAETAFVPQEDAEDYESKKSRLKEIAYICPYCFRELEDCRCSIYPNYLVEIDQVLVPVIRTLNQKGYITRACCGGHPNEDYFRQIYIAFKKDHDFGDNLPAGSKYRKLGNIVEYIASENMNADERVRFQTECIAQLMAWAEKLPPL